MVDARNPFVGRRTAQRYHCGRPYHHERTLSRILGAVAVRRGVAVDVAAGTGMSTRALAAFGFRPVGVEPVAPMLAIARQSTGLAYVVGAGEALPVADHVTSLLTVSSGVHWFDQQRFFCEALRVLTDDGVLALYEHAAIHLPEDDAFAGWLRDDYATRCPAMPRGRMVGTTREPDGLQRCFTDRWIDSVSFAHDELVAYLMTHSNVVDAIESGRETEDAVRAWIADGTARFVPRGRRQRFGFHVIAEAWRVA
jgi:SAM-dependent methyltransferase